MNKLQEVFDRHEKVAFQFSGGKDSLAALWYLHDFWDQMVVYWLDTGDAVPEVKKFIEATLEVVPDSRIIHHDVHKFWDSMGWPSDLMPADFTRMGQDVLGGTAALISSREACCVNNLMLPLHQRMLDDGITLIIRGQKNSDLRKGQLRSGDVLEGIEYLYPIETWADEDVYEFLDVNGIPLPDYYNFLAASPDCLHCTAYWEEGRGVYLKERHPKVYSTVKARLSYIHKTCLATLNTIKLFDEVPHGQH